MEWTAETIGRMYELYRGHVDRLRRDVAEANRSLGSLQPEKTNLQHLTRAEFQALLEDRADDPEVIDLWVQRIIRGHEHEFPELKAAG